MNFHRLDSPDDSAGQVFHHAQRWLSSKKSPVFACRLASEGGFHTPFVPSEDGVGSCGRRLVCLDWNLDANLSLV